MSSIFDVRKIIDPDIHTRISEAERLAIVEVCYLAIAADGVLDDAELDTFAHTMAALQGEAGVPEQIKTMVAGLRPAHSAQPQPDASAVAERLKVLAGQIPDAAMRELAYKLVCLLTMVDLETNDPEIAYDNALCDALQLSPDRAQTLVDEVVDAQ